MLMYFATPRYYCGLSYVYYRDFKCPHPDERAVLDIVSSLAVHFNDSEGLLISNGYHMTYSFK